MPKYWNMRYHCRWFFSYWNDFTDSETGMEKLDVICMQLIPFGEALSFFVFHIISDRRFSEYIP